MDDIKDIHKKPGKVWWWVAAACGVIFLFSCFMLVRELVRAEEERGANRQLAEQVRSARENGMGQFSDGEKNGEALSDILPAYAGLWNVNHDLIGWLSMEELGIDLPVMYHPSDPEYYLYRAFDGSDAVSGSLFLSDEYDPEDKHVIIYGHNMKNGTMFGNLEQYNSLEYALEHPTFRFDSLTQEREYMILAAFYSQLPDSLDDEVPGEFPYYQYTSLRDREIFGEYIAKVRSAALYDTGLDVQYGDSLLTLSTCSYHKKNGRFVVVARQKAISERSCNYQ